MDAHTSISSLASIKFVGLVQDKTTVPGLFVVAAKEEGAEGADNNAPCVAASCLSSKALALSIT